MAVIRTHPDGSKITLFKYFSPSALADFVCCRVSLTPPKFFNDRFEFAVRRDAPDRKELEAMVDEFEKQEYERESRPQISFAVFKEGRTEIREAWITRVMSEEYREAEPAKMRDLLSELWGVVCLTEVPDNVLMWSNYADSYRGVRGGVRLRLGTHDVCPAMQRNAIWGCPKGGIYGETAGDSCGFRKCWELPFDQD